MKLSKFLGRILLALLFVNAGIKQLQDTESYVKYVNIRYPHFHSYTQNLIGSQVPIPEQLVFIIDIQKPDEFLKHTSCLIKSLGWAQIIFGFGVGIGIQGAGCLLALLTAVITVFAHNPIIYSAQVDADKERLQIIFNIGIIGALFLVQGQKKTNKICGGPCIGAGKKVADLKKDGKKEEEKVAPEEKKEKGKGREKAKGKGK